VLVTRMWQPVQFESESPR